MRAPVHIAMRRVKRRRASPCLKNGSVNTRRKGNRVRPPKLYLTRSLFGTPFYGENLFHMPPGRVPEFPVHHERVALIAAESGEANAKPKSTARFDDRINPRWLRIPAAVKYSGISRCRLFRLIRD